MKKLLLFAITFAVMLSSCSDGYKNYLPSDSKLVGKIDLKEFFTQTGVDHDQLFKDLGEAYGDDMKNLQESGLDMTKPMYFFAKNKDDKDLLFGGIVKLEDRAKAEGFFAKKTEQKVEKVGDYSFLKMPGGGFAFNDEVVVIMSCTNNEADIKADFEKIMKKEGSADLAKNKLFEKVDGSSSFASVYVDGSIIPEEVTKQAAENPAVSNQDIEDLKTMTYGIDGSANDGVCDFAVSFVSSNKEVQAKYDKMLEAYGTIGEKAAASLQGDALFGLACNVDGTKLLAVVKDLLSKKPDSEELVKMLDKFAVVFNKLKGDVTFSFKNENDFFFKADGQDFTEDLVGLMKTEMGVSEGQDGLTKADNGYCLAGKAWLGYAGNNFYLTTDSGIAQNPAAKLAGPALPSAFAGIMKDRRFVAFANVDQVLKLQGDEANSKELKAFKAVTDKVKFVALSSK